MKIVSNRFSILCVALGLASFLTHQSQAQVVASDVASNYTGVSTGTNGGTGFGPWTVTTGTGGFAGIFVGNPGAAGITDLPNPSFGMYANPAGQGAGVVASRSFSNALSVGQTFSLRWAVNWDADTGSKGFRLFSGGASGTQVAHVQQAGFPGNVTFQGTSNSTAANAITAFGTGPMTWTFTMSNATTLIVTSSARNGTTNVVFSTNLTVSAAPDGIQFYATNMPDGFGQDNRQPYFNNLQISQGDGTPPTVTLSNRLVALLTNGIYTPTAASANDDVDGDVTASISNNAVSVLTSSNRAPGTYTVTYSAKDAANNTGSATQTVVVHPVGAFASLYSNVVVAGLFTEWNFSGTPSTTLQPTANFQRKLIYHFASAAASNAPYLIAANGGSSIKWGAGGARGAADANLSPTVDTNGWYVFSLNEATDTAGFAKLAAADGDTDGIPDEWEAYFGAQLSQEIGRAHV